MPLVVFQQESDVLRETHSSHSVFPIIRLLDKHFGVVRFSLSDAVLQGRGAPSREQWIRALAPLELPHLSDLEIDSFQKRLLRCLWSKLDVQDLGVWYSEVCRIFSSQERDAKTGFVKGRFPDFSATAIESAVLVLEEFYNSSSRQSLVFDNSAEFLDRISACWTGSYALEQQEDDSRLQSIKELLMGLLVLVGPKFKIDAVCCSEDKVVIVSANSADKVEGVPFVEANLPFSKVESLKKLYESDEYLKLIIQQYLALGISPIELLIVLHNNDLCQFERGSDGVQYLLKLIDHSVLTEACAREMLKNKDLSSLLMSIIADVGSSVFHEYKVSSVLLERLQQIAIYWLKIPDIFGILDISDTAEKYSQALLVLAAMLKQANLFNTSMQTHQYSKCTRFAKYLAYVALSPTNVLAMTISPVTGQQQQIKPEDIVASVLTDEQLRFAIRGGDVSGERFRFNQGKGLTVYVETDNLELNPEEVVNILLQRCGKLTKADNLRVNPLLWDPSFVERQSSNGNYTASVFAVATEHWIAGSSHLKVWSYNRSTHIEGAADFEENFCSFGDPTRDEVPTIVHDCALNNEARRIHVLQVRAPADSTVVYSGKAVSVVPDGTLPVLDVNSLFQNAQARAAVDPYLLSNLILPLTQLIPSLDSVDRRRALSILSTVSSQSAYYDAYFGQVTTQVQAQPIRQNFENTQRTRRLAITAALSRGAVRRTIDGRVVNSSDEWLALYNLIVLSGAFILPLVWRVLEDDPYLDSLTDDPKLIEIVIRSILPVVLASLVLTFGSTLPLLYQLGTGILSPLRRLCPRLFDRRMDADVKSMLASIEGSSVNPALISRLAGIIAATRYEVPIGAPDHPYELLEGLFRELLSRGQDSLAHHLLVMLTSKQEERRDVGPREYWFRMSVLRPASRVVVPSVLLGLAIYTIPDMYSTIRSEPVQDNGTPLLKFLAIAGILLNTPGVPLGLIFIVLLHLMERSFDFDFFKLKVIDNCLAVLDALVVRPVRYVGNRVSSCIGSVGAFATRPALGSSPSLNDDDPEGRLEGERRPLLPSHTK